MRKPPGKPPSQRREQKPRGDHRPLRAVANILTQASRQQGKSPDETRKEVLEHLRGAWQDGRPRQDELTRVGGELCASPRVTFAYALWMDDFTRRDEHAYETAAAIVLREVERELSDPGYTNRPGYRDEEMF